MAFMVVGQLGKIRREEKRPSATWAEMWVEEYKEKGFHVTIYNGTETISETTLREMAKAERKASSAAATPRTPEQGGPV